MQDMNTDNVKREDLRVYPSKSPILLGRTTEIAQRYSETGQMDDIVSTDCKVVIKMAVEGRARSQVGIVAGTRYELMGNVSRGGFL